MSVHYITGSTADNDGGSSIVNVGVSTRTDVQGVISGNSHLKNDGNKAVKSSDQTTIRQSASGAVVHISQSGRYVAINLGGTLNPDNTFSVTAASYPFSRVYKVLGTSGNYTVTTTPYTSCTGIGASGNYSTAAGSFDSPTQGQFVMQNYTTELAGITNTALQTSLSNAQRSVHAFKQYRSHIYTNYFDSVFGASGTVGPCDVTTTVVTLATDQAASGVPTVIMSLGSTPQAADLEHPDTTGLRVPA